MDRSAALVRGSDALAARVATGRRISLAMYPELAQAMLTEGSRRHWREKLTWISPDGGTAVTIINPGNRRRIRARALAIESPIPSPKSNGKIHEVCVIDDVLLL